MKVLILSAHTLLREGIVLILRPLHPQAAFLEACNSLQARHVTDSHADIDLALVHVRLSTTEGRMVLRELGSCCPGVPILAISDTVNEEDRACAFKLGAWGYIGKAACGEDLLRAARVVLSGTPYVLHAWSDSEDRPYTEMARAPQTGAWRMSSVAKPAWAARLTVRQLEVLDLLTEGMPNKLIARRLGLACGTVKCHVSAVLRAMNATNRTQAVASMALGGVPPRPPKGSDGLLRLH